MSQLAPVDTRIARIATDRDGVVRSTDALAQEISPSSLSRRARAGQLIRLASGIYAPPYAASLAPTRIRATLASCDGLAALAGGAAAAHDGHWKRHVGGTVVLTRGRVPQGKRLPGIVIRSRRDLDIAHVRESHGITTTVPARTCCDLGTTLTKFQIAHVMYEAAYHGALDLELMSGILDRRRGARGVVAARGALQLFDSGSAGTRSASEDRLLDALIALCVPEPIVNTRGSMGGNDIEPDYLWPELRLNIEVDGPWHDKPEIAAADAFRDAALHVEGWRVIRIRTDVIWNDLQSACAIVLRALKARDTDFCR